MYGLIKRWTALFLVCVCLGAAPSDALAATKPINSVSIRVSSKLKAGNALPDIQTGSGSAAEGGVVVSSSGSTYSVVSAEWLDSGSKELMAADEPRMKVTLEPEDVSEYYFLASYKASSVKVSGGSFVSAKREGDNLAVTLRVNPVTGDYDSPTDVYWNEKNLGEAVWEKPENTSGHYEVQLLRNNKNVFKVEDTTATRYNFYPYMTQTGEYTFKVRTVPSTDIQKKYGKRSDWLESGELEITDRYVSDGKGQQSSSPEAVKGTQEKTGWFQEGNLWKYRYPSGSLCTSAWENIDGNWYYFDGNSDMATGWQNIAGEQYYFHGNGQMAVGWTKVDNVWYYFRPEKEGGRSFGSMFNSGWRVIAGYYYYFNQDGSLYTGWLELDGKRYYMNTLENSLQGAMFTGWIRRDEKTYFADTNGEIITGWYEIDGSWYYFYPDSGEMARDTQIDGLVIDSDGIWR